MNIRDIRDLKNTAAQRLSGAPQANRIVMIYAGITVGLAALVTVVNYCLSLEISQTGGLSNIGLRSILSTIQTILPMAQWLVLLCLEVGYLNAMLRIGRSQYASPNSLRMGFDRFWQVLRCSVVQGAVYMGILFLGMYLAIQIFLLTPMSRDAISLINGITGGLGTTDPMDAAMMLDDATYFALMQSMLPILPIFLVVGLALFLPRFYGYRMVNYILIDNPRMPTLLILRESRKMMKRNRLALFKLDLSLWWYFLLSFLSSAAAYGDVLLPMLGITLPFSETVGYFLFYAVYLVLQFVICYLFLNRVSVTYALAYESLLPEKPQEGGVVLGNIFQM